MSAEARTVYLDITRLIGRAGEGSLTGIDRVERAYLAELIRRGGSYRLVCRTAVDFLLIGPAAAPRILGWIDDTRSLPPTPAMARLIARARRTPALEAALRRVADRRLRHGNLSRWIAARDSAPVWLSVGHTNLTDRLLGALRRVPGLTLAVMIHDTIPIDHPDWSGPRAPAEFRRKLEAALGHAQLILCPTAVVADDVRRWAATGGHRPDLVTAQLGVEPALPRPDLIPADLPRNRPYFVILGTIEPRKDHALLLDLWAEFHATLPADRIPRLFIAGRRGWRNEVVFRRLDTEPFMGRTVFELAGLPDGAVAALLQGATALLAPSRAEGFGLPAAEAAALAVPVIASDLPVTRELLGSWPVYAPPGDMYAWRKAIITMARQADSGQARPFPARVPDWGTHFNLIFGQL